LTRSLVHGKLLAAGLGGVLLAALVASALAPSSASAGILRTPIPNPVDAVKGLIGVPGDVAAKLGATVLQQALEWLLGGLKATITLEFVKFLVHVELAVGESLAKLTGPMIVIGGFFLIVGLITSIGDGYREVVAGTDTAPRVIGQAIFRVIALAILLGSWFWIVPLAVDVANGMSGYVLSDEAVGSSLRRTFAGEKLLQGGFPLLGLLTGIMLAFAILALVVLKFIIAIAFACLYLGGPALIGFAALPRVGNLPLAIATRGLLTLTIIPLLWTVVFAAWAGVNAGMFDTATGGGSLSVGLMGPGLFLAGLVVMLSVTKKVLAMATFGVALSVPGAALARSVITMAVTRGLGRAASGAAAAGSATSGSDVRPDVPSRGSGDTKPGAQRTVERVGQPAPSRQRSYRPLDTSGSAERHDRDRAAHRRQAAETSNAALGVDREGAFVPPRGVSREVVEHVGREVDDRRARGEVSVDDVRRAGDALTAADRSAFAAAAEAAQKGGPDRAQRHFERTARVQIAGAPALDTSERGAAITIASAHPEVVQQAFASDYRSFAREDDPAGSGYDRDLFDRQGGLERLREKFEGKPARAQDRPPDDEGLPF
jgi:hypothetical protein